jgi:hypothetical protein
MSSNTCLSEHKAVLIVNSKTIERNQMEIWSKKDALDLVTGMIIVDFVLSNDPQDGELRGSGKNGMKKGCLRTASNSRD